MKKSILILTILIIMFHTSLFAKSPYHSLDENNYEQVVNALEKPEWLNRYCKENFHYVSDKNQYGKQDIWVSSKTMFYAKKGDCEDWANFQYSVLKHHNINAELFGISDGQNAHLITMFYYKNNWSWMDVSGLYQNYSTKNELLNSLTDNKKLNYQFINNYNEKEYSNNNFQNNKKHYMISDRLNIHLHLTDCPYGIDFFLPIKNNNHNFSFGYLHNLNNSLFNGIGFSFSSHGYYSDFKTSNKMYSFHFLIIKNIFGISPYFGDYYGLDFDIHCINLKFIDGYICYRNFGEIIDYKLNIKCLKYFYINSEIRDCEIIVASYFNISDSVQIIYSSNKTITLNLTSIFSIVTSINVNLKKNIDSIIIQQKFIF